MKNLLGGKGANLAEMAKMDLPVPPGFTITTEVCTRFYSDGGKYPQGLTTQVEAAVAEVGDAVGAKFGDAERPLLVSVRSGARVSMPGMMDTVLNLGLNDETVEGLASRSGDRRFAYDSYRRFIQMYSDVVLGVEHHRFEDILGEIKDERGFSGDTELTAEDWRAVLARYKACVQSETGKAFPQDVAEQLWGAIGAVFEILDVGARRHLSQACTAFRATGAPRLPSRPWFSAISARRRRPALPSPAILRPATRRFTANSSSMRKARMSSPVSARRRTSPKRPASRPGRTNHRSKP